LDKSIVKLGVGDMHNSKYNDIFLTSTMTDLQDFAADSKYVGLPVDDAACMYTFHVYPSDEMEEGKMR
jgi:hypothetical protein